MKNLIAVASLAFFTMSNASAVQVVSEKIVQFHDRLDSCEGLKGNLRSKIDSEIEGLVSQGNRVIRVVITEDCPVAGGGGEGNYAEGRIEYVSAR